MFIEARSLVQVWGVALIAAAPAAFAQEPDGRFDVGVRGVILLSQGQPANDMVGEGLIARWRMRDQWHLGIAFDTVTFDYETPNRELGIAAASVVDGSNNWSRSSILLERRYDTERRWDWFWTAGIGFASLDAIRNVAGVRAGGGSFDIATVADDEVHLFGGAGLRRPVGAHWAVEATFTVEHHSTDYELIDLVSQTRGSIGAQSPYGIAIVLSYSF